MLSRQTVFVLGAGSSAAYGFSTGEALLQSAREMSIEQMQHATEDAGGRRQFLPIHDALQRTGMASIDAMLEHQPQLWPALKALMAALLLQEEEAVMRRNLTVTEDWIGLVVQNMATDARTIDEFAGNPVSFVTFNYDRFFEYRIARNLAQHYNIAEPAVWEAMQHIPILHVHGSLGALPQQQLAHAVQPIPFGAPDAGDIAYKAMAVRAAMQNTKIVHEVTEDEHTFLAARNFLQNAVQVVFLGFSFAGDNVRHLGTHAAIPNTAHVYCTTYDMTAAEVNADVVPAFNRPTVFQHANMKARQFLREHIDVLR